MLSEIKSGWCKFSLGNFVGNPSYVTDVPVDLLRCFKRYYEENYSCCYLDEEGSDFTLVISRGDIYI